MILFEKQEGKCRGCGRRIYWVTTSSGTKHPLDAVAPVFEFRVGADARHAWVRSESAYVSHFVTCAKRDEFKKPKGEKP